MWRPTPYNVERSHPLPLHHHHHHMHHHHHAPPPPPPPPPPPLVRTYSDARVCHETPRTLHHDLHDYRGGGIHSSSMYHGGHPPPPPPPPPPIRASAYGREAAHYYPPPPPPAYHHPHHHPPARAYPPPPPPIPPRTSVAPTVPTSYYEPDVSESLASFPPIGGGCTCKKSKCLKLYCQCFSSSTTCGPKCKCQACHNTPLHKEAIEEARRVILERNPSAFDTKFGPYSTPSTVVSATQTTCAAPTSSPVKSMRMVAPSSPQSPPPSNKAGCKCRRSFCLKKYCECFTHGVKCGINCRCVNCRNQPDPASESDKPQQTHLQELPLQPQLRTVQIPIPSQQEQPQPPYQHLRSPRRVSDVGLSESSDPQESSSASSDSAAVPDCEATRVSLEGDEGSADRMAIMAAVAMTELLGSGGLKRKASTDEDEEEFPFPKRVKSDDDDERAVISSSSSASSVTSSPQPLAASPRASPVSMTMYRPHPSYPSSFGYPMYCGRASPKAYEETTRLSGLPKSLSFRKICSKCGKTRGEHGELGFGHRCVYQDCGKCGAGVQMHVKAGVPMGILCTLKVEDGATPGAADAYERKIQDLAVRAELQQKLQQQRTKEAAV